jgi:hypothetical protein
VRLLVWEGVQAIAGLQRSGVLAVEASFGVELTMDVRALKFQAVAVAVSWLGLASVTVADPIYTFSPVAVGSVEGLSGTILADPFISRTDRPGFTQQRHSAIVEFDVAALSGVRVASWLTGTIQANDFLDTGRRDIGAVVFPGNGDVDVLDFSAAGSHVGSVSYHPTPFGADYHVAFSFNLTIPLQRLIDSGASDIAVRFEGLNFQAPSVLSTPDCCFSPTQLHVTPVPEPGTLLLFGTGAAGLIASRHRRAHGWELVSSPAADDCWNS